MISETNTTEITKQENISMESNENNNTTDTSFDSSGKKLRRRTVNRGLDGNYWGKIEMLVETKPKRKRKTVERLYVGDAVLNIDDDEDTKDVDDKKSETRLHI
jgi:DNA helicase IV